MTFIPRKYLLFLIIQSTKMKKIILIIGLVFSVIGCDDTLTVQNVDDKVIPDSNVSFAEHIYPVFQVKCAFSGCHASPNPAYGIDLSTYAVLQLITI